MVEFNLLPWRDARYRYEINIITRWCLFALFMSMAICAILYWQLQKQNHELLREEKKQQFIYQQLLYGNKQIADEKSFFIAPDKINRHNNLTRLFVLLGTEKITDVCFNKLIYRKNQFTFSGKTFSLYHLSHFLEKSTLSSALGNFNIDKIKKQSTAFEFQLTGSNFQ